MPRSSAVHRLDARTKLACAALLAAAAVAGSDWRVQGLVGAACAAAFVAARLPAALAWAGVRGAFWILLFVAAANLGWNFWSARFGWGGAEPGVGTPAQFAVLLGRLFDLVLLSTVFSATTLPVDAAHALERLLRPLARLRLPVREAGLLVVLTLGFVPVFFREASALAAAHRIKRGRVRWTWADRLRALVPLTVPLFLAVARRADELAVALDARCFDPGAPRTAFGAGRAGVRDGAAVLVCGAVFVASVLH